MSALWYSRVPNKWKICKKNQKNNNRPKSKELHYRGSQINPKTGS